MALCTACGERSVTKPQLGMCNVCYADMMEQQRARANHRNEQVTAMTKVKKREELRAETAYMLREMAAGRAPALTEILDRAATILEGREDVLLLLEPKPEPRVMVLAEPKPEPRDAKLEAQIAAFVAPLDPETKRDEAMGAGLIIVHGGTE